MEIKIATPPAMKTPTTITAIVIIEDGVPPYTYMWGNGTTHVDCTVPNEPQTISVTVTDHESQVATDSLVIG